VAKINVPVEELIQHGKPRAPKGFYFSHWKGQLLLKKRPVINPKKFTDVQKAWVEHFKTFACWSKQPDPQAYNFAHDYAAKTGWYYRDVLERAFSGKLLMQQGEIKITVPTVRVQRLVAQAMTNGADTYMTPSASVWDNNVFWNPTVNPTRLTIRTPGLYIVGARMIWSATAGGIRYTEMRLNRTSPVTKDSVPGSNASTIESPLISLYYFHQNDYIEMVGFCNVAGVTCALGEFWMCAITPEAII